MAILSNFPLVSQLTSVHPGLDPDPNGPMDCVPASIGAAILWYKKRLYWTPDINPDSLKNAAYSDFYTGSTSAAAYTAICQELGFHLYAVESANYASAIQKAHELLRAGLPVIFTQQDDYSSNPGYSHVCVFFAEGANNLTCLDPYIAAPLQYSDAQWTNRLRSSELWIVEPVNVNEMDLTMLQLTDPMGRFFVEKTAMCWHCPSTNVDIHDAHLDFYRRHEGVFGLPLFGELYLEQLKGTAIMIYERGIAIYDPRRIVDNPPGAGAIYPLHIDEGIGQQIIAKPLIAALNDELAAMQAELAKRPDAASVQALQQKISGYEHAITQLSSIIVPLAAQIQ